VLRTASFALRLLSIPLIAGHVAVGGGARITTIPVSPHPKSWDDGGPCLLYVRVVLLVTVLSARHALGRGGAVVMTTGKGVIFAHGVGIIRRRHTHYPRDLGCARQPDIVCTLRCLLDVSISLLAVQQPRQAECIQTISGAEPAVSVMLSLPSLISNGPFYDVMAIQTSRHEVG
jgi:hypothetical protein